MAKKDLLKIKESYKVINDSFTREDLLNQYYYPALQDFIDGKIEDFDTFFSFGPGRFLLRFLMDRFCYHTNNSKDICETYLCCDGSNCDKYLENGIFKISENLSDATVGKNTDFLKLKSYLNKLNFITERKDFLKKCDRCIHRYYCGMPCIFILKEKNVKLNLPEDRCYITHELFKWYENHMNSILKVIYNHSSSHGVKFIEDDMYTRIVNERLNSKFFYTDLFFNKSDDFYNYLVVRLK